MPTVELDIRQLADEGGTAPLAPITVTDAVLDEDGNTLTDILDELKSGSVAVTTTYGTVPTRIISISSNVTFTSGVGSVDFSANIPNGYMIVFPLCVMNDTSSLYITGCTSTNNGKGVSVKCKSDYTGTVGINFLLPIIKTS